MKRRIRTSLRWRLTWGISLAMAGMGLALFLYVASLPYWVLPAAGGQRLALEPATSSGEANPRAPFAAREGNEAFVALQGWQRQRRFWLYGAAGMALFTVLASLVVYFLTGRFLTSLHRLQHTVAHLPLDPLPARLPPMGDEEEIRTLVAAYNAFIDKVQGVLQAHRQFVADAAHELRSPLSALQMQLDVLRTALDLSPQEREQVLEDARQAVAQLGRTVDSLLLLLREPRPELWTRVDLWALTQQVVTQLQPLAQAQGVHLYLEGTTTLVRGEAALLQVIVRNLVQNALLYNDPGGQVRVKVFTRNGGAVLEVQDTGWGISPEEQRYIFERFYRGRKAQTREGSGLGLALVRRLVEMHGGRVQMESRVGQGSRFVVHLPLARPT